MDKGLLTRAVFIDLSKAFDTVSHSNLLNKLTSFGIRSYELEWFTNYLFNRAQYVSFDGSISEKFQVTSGVPQGSILGTLLFIYHIIKYADDTVLLLAGRDTLEIGNQLSGEMQVVGKWLDENDLIINLSKGKTESMLLGTSRKIQNNSLIKRLPR